MVILVSEPEALQQILTSNVFNERPDWFRFFRLKYGLINARRKTLMNFTIIYFSLTASYFV